ncbi:MAG TPA: hypothetical protein VGG33_09870 [Polyangia bacterium]
MSRAKVSGALLLVMAAHVGGACSSTYQVSKLTPGLAKEIKAKHPHHDLEVRLRNPALPENVVESLALVGATDTHAQLRIQPGALADRPLVLRKGEILAIPSDDVTEIFVKDHGKGFLAGAGAGFGFVALTAIAGAATYDKNDDFFRWGRGGEAAAFGIVFGGPLLLTSMLIGGIAGWTTHYRF